MWYVHMTDKMLSGWGEAENTLSKYVIECESHAQAEAVADKARRRPEMVRVVVTPVKPRFPKRYRVDYEKAENLGGSWR